MAKVYSWQISQSPEKYAYIVHPNDLTKPYIGVELAGDNLQKVIDWASTCTDTEYEAQFNKMKKLCLDSNYDVEFEDVTAYINVKASCDNLRGPAGRGIKSISLYDDNIITNISTYVITYDDGDTDTFEIRNGRDGVNGINGKDGIPGDTGISSKIIMIYTTGRDGEGNIIVPQRPVGGSYNFATNKVTYPSGWKSNDSDLLPPVWMSSRTFNSNGTTDGDWTTPMQITGEQGINGEDGESMEFIFRLDKNEPDTTHLASENTKGYVPIGWTASPCGITETEQTEWCSTRHLDTKTGVWGKWSQATRWAQWGAAGLDGDGIQYIFMRTPKSNPPKNPTPFGYKTDAKYQQKYTEWIPSVGSNYKNLYGDSIIFREGDELWSDDPVEVSNTFPYQWVCTRKYLKEEGNKEKTWQAYSEPALWGKYGENGVSGAIVRVLYCRTDSPSIKPDVPKDAIVYGDWGIAVPEYDTAVQAVWAISAELDATTLEFKEKYNITTNHSDSNLENTLEVVELPVYHLDEYKYIIYKEQYYTWGKSSWSEPYLISGIKGDKGDSGITPTYTTYVYTYYDAQTLPPQPTNYVFPNPTSQTSNGTIIKWEDFPDTSGGRVDTESKRWYQCIGIVNALTNAVSEWGDVVICNARDGNYTEFRYAVTSGLTAPSLTEAQKKQNIPEFFEKGTKKGWFTTSDGIPTMPKDGGMWQIHAVKYKGELTSGSTWSNPVRISGEKGEQGKEGPVGKTGSTGIPGVGIIQMYCLGTETKPFGGTGYTQTVVDSDLTGWFDAQHIPSSITIKVNNLDEVKDYAKNDGRVICVITQNEKEDIEHQYYRIEDGKVIELTEKILKDEDDFGVYIWCIQGSDIYSHNASADTYTRTGIRWGLPFKIQGSNGLRGFTGSRGQVVYPMGVYNPNEVYKTTETKAPYVYDPNDGMYYVYNIVGAPWVGVLPEGYKTIKDKDGNFKYSLDGTGNANTWMSDRNGETPANDYANAVKPSWVRFDSYDAIYTSIGIIANGMIGSAVYNNEFMFSQQGVNTSGAPCNYADNGVEFLSGYEYDEKGNSYGYHWKYKGTSTYIKDINVNPYELNNNKPIHTFRPNVCINFATGQMWLACGKIVLGQSEVNFYTSSETNNQISGANSALENKLSGLIDKNKQDLQKDLGHLQNALTSQIDGVSDIYYSDKDPSGEWKPEKITDKIGDLWFNTNKDISYIFCTENSSSSIESAFSKKNTSVSPKYYWRPTSVPQSIFDTIDGKAQVFVTEPTAGTSYNKCDLWFVDKNYGSIQFYNNITGITSGMCLVCMKSGVVSGNTWYQDWAKADDYLTQAQTESLIENNTELLKDALKQYIDDIKQTDGKADAYYSATDPSSGWTTTNASEHIGDIWFHSVSGISYVYCNEQKGNFINSKQSGYYWRTTDIPEEIYDVVDGYAQIFIEIPQPPYHIGDLWFVENNNYSGKTFYDGTTGITSGTCMVAMEDSTGTTINYADWAKRDSYANEATIKQIEETINKDVNDFKSAVSGLTTQLEGKISALEKQVDKKVDVYYSDNDPSSGWTATDVPNKIGDMWYDTNDGISYEFCAEDGNGYNTKSAFSEKNPTVTPTYYWRPSMVPGALFDKLDGFAQVFIDKPTVAYEPGDLWYIRTNAYSAQTFYNGVTGVTSGSCLVCVSGNTNSTPSTNFRYADWATLEYADIAQLNNAIVRLNEFGSDNLITPNEMKTLKEEWGRISGDTTILNLLSELGIQEDGKTGDIHKNFRIGFAKAEAAYAYFTDTKNATAGVNHDSIQIPILDLGPIYSSNDVVYYNYSSISEYYRIKQATTEAINNAINKKATNSQQKIEYWGKDNLINPSEIKLLLKEYQKFKEEHKTIEELLHTYDVDVDSDGYYYSYEETELEDGSIQKPSDATDKNVKVVSELPKEKNTDASIKYLKYGDHYYTWQYSYQIAYEKAVFAYDYFTTISNANSTTGCIAIPKEDLTGNGLKYNYSSITQYYVAKEQILDKFNKIKIKTEVEFKVGIDSIKGTVTETTSKVNTILQSGFITTASASTLFSTLINNDKNIVKRAELGTYIKKNEQGILESEVIISGDKVRISGETILNDNVKFTTDGRLQALGATIDGDITAHYSKYKSVVSGTTGVTDVKGSLIKGGGTFRLPHLASGEVIKLTAFNPQVSSNPQAQILLPYSSSTITDGFWQEGDPLDYMATQISIRGWCELMGFEESGVTRWVYYGVNGGVGILSYSSGGTIYDGEPPFIQVKPGEGGIGELIWFYISDGGQRNEYTSVKGMTWGAWVSSSYNTGGYTIGFNTAVVVNSNNNNVINAYGISQTKDMLIIANHSYKVDGSSGGGLLPSTPISD